MKCEHGQFGSLEFEEKHVVNFPDGIVGFTHLHRFLILDDPETEPFRWLVSLDETSLAFPLISPEVINLQYSANLPHQQVTVFLVTVLGDRLEEATTNLRSPIVIDHASRTGQQMILDDESLPLHFSLFQSQNVVGE